MFINNAVYLFLLNSNQLPAAPVMQKDKETGNNAQSLQTKFYFSRATCNQKEFKNHVMPDFKIVLFILKSSSMLYTLIFCFSWWHVPNNSDSINPTKPLFDSAIVRYKYNDDSLWNQ